MTLSSNPTDPVTSFSMHLNPSNSDWMPPYVTITIMDSSAPCKTLAKFPPSLGWGVVTTIYKKDVGHLAVLGNPGAPNLVDYVLLRPKTRTRLYTFLYHGILERLVINAIVILATSAHCRWFGGGARYLHTPPKVCLERLPIPPPSASSRQ